MKAKIIEALKESGNEQLAEFFKSDRKKIIYGQGLQARIVWDMCNRLGISVEGFMCGSQQDLKNRRLDLPKDVPGYTSDEKVLFDKTTYDIIIAVNPSHNEKIVSTLKDNNFVNIYYLDNWEEPNKVFMESFYNAYLKERVGEKYDYNSNILEYGDFKIINYKNQPEFYGSMLIGDFFDNIAPSIFNDFRYVLEGADEDENVKVKMGDIVFDLGANIGMFSCVAASRGGVVYAFEPTPETLKYTQKNADLYSNFFVEPYAVSDNVGTCRFYINNLTMENVNSAANTMFSDRMGINMDYTDEIEVPTITIDEFVKRNNLERVDFIKADIEGAERYMLMGAKETLAKYAPKLALCTYHLPDDPQVMEKLILEYNPKYIIKHINMKLMAYVEK